MAKKIDITKLDLDELKALQKEVAKAIEGYEVKRRQEAKAAAEAAAREFGFSINELLGSGRAKKASGPAKYRHPENPSVTWTGKGRQPGWIKEAVAAGKKMEDFLI